VALTSSFSIQPSKRVEMTKVRRSSNCTVPTARIGRTRSRRPTGSLRTPICCTRTGLILTIPALAASASSA